MKQNIQLIDTSLRDGAQAPGIYFNEQDKLFIAEALEKCGVEIIEAGIPAMGKEEQQTIVNIKERLQTAKVLVWNRLVKKDIMASMDCGADIIHLSIPISDRHITDKLHTTRTDIKNKVLACLEFVRNNNYDVSVGLEDASRCEEDFLIEMVNTIHDYDPLFIRYADTVGILTPTMAYKNIKMLVDCSDTKIGFHGHNDLGLATANTLAAVQAGAEFIDTTVLGIGERAGNCDFFKIIKVLTTIHATEISVAEAETAQNSIADLIGKEWRHTL